MKLTLGNFSLSFLQCSLIVTHLKPTSCHLVNLTKFILTVKTDKGIGLCLGASANRLAKDRDLSPS